VGLDLTVDTTPPIPSKRGQRVRHLTKATCDRLRSLALLQTKKAYKGAMPSKMTLLGTFVIPKQVKFPDTRAHSTHLKTQQLI
jgi:hypothetical protein